MQQFYPQSFLDILATLVLLLGLLFILFSLRKKDRQYSLKRSSILFLISLSIFSSNAWCYLATIFIIATAITELEFLQNLAAIIRGSEAYFRYKKEFVPKKEVEDAIAAELKFAAKSLQNANVSKSEITFPLDKKLLSNTQTYVIAEELVFRYLERLHGSTISRHIRYRGGGSTLITFDGVMEWPKKAILFEIIIPSGPHLLKTMFRKRIGGVLYAALSYEKLTKKETLLKVIVVSDLIKEKIDELDELARAMIEKTKWKVDISIEQLSFDEIGLLST